MKAIVIHRFGGPEVLQAVQVAEPVVNPSEVLVRVKATSVNPLDYQARRGDYPQEVPLPAIIGYDVAGDVVATGTAVKDFKVGDAVYYSPRIFGGQGSYAEFHAVEESIIALKPANLSYAEAASLPLAAGTAWEMLVTRAQLGIGESILIHGGAGGVGSIAIQLAKAMGATVLTTAKGIHTPRLRDLGADHVIDYRHEDYLSKVDELTQGRGVDVIIDSIGGMTLSESPRVLAQLGRVVTLVDIATPQNLIHAWGKNATYHFVFTRQNRGKLDGITRLVEHGLIKPVIDSSFSLEEIAKAHQRLEGNDRVKDLLGKIVIEL
ncbi:MAG: Bifunctional protein: zinc-containing alcohol dehydrogenase; quinone oxidoreductase (NADPH:quinone reductase); Similar to arginate lyase [uncultured Cytophagales bacterium]|uniref:Bifunctional protein: zinc-containing alcohol dehydrogenase quinone oxidoreductase ( NADPH:quinone reductase) Similar to arginate lyase n=1 Tax=uncultured Cytophagales bacterium TaxID=158755 RepID=A0A6J4IUY1_9SPHI|nr:MAG: Bifunctional protein: zinc-containing alcohol dehydrogenase; quinone oxidoreductase (NADPH:quinone reductase); Similar to arginate lyase [uncultured Cytophagales bacterium]